jgi:DNA-binding NarL/FixJ family response regulator
MRRGARVMGRRRLPDAPEYPYRAGRRDRTMDGVSATTILPAASRDIRVLVIDDHPALRAGLRDLLDNEPGFDCIAALSPGDGLLAAVAESRPDVVVLDYALGADDGLSTCFRLKQQPRASAVILYSAYVDHVFAVPAAIAQADAAVAKTAPIDELLSAIRAAAADALDTPRLDAELVQAASARLLADDLPIAAMLLDATPVRDIAMTLGMSVDEVRRRALRIIGRLQAGNRGAGRAARAGSVVAS